jgi:hypothetical protein
MLPVIFPCYPGTAIPVRAGDLVRWHNDEVPTEVIFVVSTGDFPPRYLESKQWFVSKFGQGIMIKTELAGLVLESEDCSNVTLVLSLTERA